MFNFLNKIFFKDKKKRGNVYCIDCRYIDDFLSDDNNTDPFRLCSNENNMLYYTEISPIRIKSYRELQKCSLANEYNNCPYFEKK